MNSDKSIFSDDRTVLLHCDVDCEHYNIPEGTKRIASEAFDDTGGFPRSITLPSSLEEFNPCEALEILDICSLQTIDVADGSKYFTAIDGILYNKDVTRLIFIPPYNIQFGGTYDMPDTVREIGDFALCMPANLNRYYLSKSLEKIGKGNHWPSGEHCIVFIPEGMPAAQFFTGSPYFKTQIIEHKL